MLYPIPVDEAFDGEEVFCASCEVLLKLAYRLGDEYYCEECGNEMERH